MTPNMREIIAQYTLKGWRYDELVDFGPRSYLESPHCMYCGALLRFAFKCSHPNDGDTEYRMVIYLGSECVNSFIDGINGQESVAFLKAKWRQRRRYFWKRFDRTVVIVGPHKGKNTWWAALGAQLLDQDTWRFSHRRFATAREAQSYVTTYVLTGGTR